MTYVKIGAISEMITGISGMIGKTGAKTAETYGMVQAGREATDGRTALKTKQPAVTEVPAGLFFHVISPLHPFFIQPNHVSLGRF